MIQHYYRNVHAVVFVYDVTNKQSFEDLPHWLEECNAHNLTNEIPRVVVGNKCDDDEHTVVDTNAAQIFADLHDMPLFETSAKKDSEIDNVEAIFMTLAHKLLSAKPLMPADKSRQVVNLGTHNRPIYEDTDETTTCWC